MSESLLRSWWLPGLRGFIAILFGLAAILWPAITVVTLAALCAAFALLAGIVAALQPGLTTVALILLMGANALVTGVLDIVVALRVRKFIKRESLLVLSGAVSILFGAVVLLFPMGAGPWRWPG